MTLGISSGTLAVQGGLIDVAGGEGGKVTLRAPVIVQPGADTVNVAFAGSIAGAREIVLEGFKRFDLANLANNPNFVGVKINSSGQAELDLAATATGKLNVLADYGAGTLVEFVRDFDISASYGTLGGLAGQANFHARPGMELNYAGDIVLKSNWNLGAGIVDDAGARAAGVMGFDAILNKSYVMAGRQAELLTNHTTMVYRTQGSIFGEPGVLSLRAGGDLVLEGSVTDGFFQFADPLDKDYLAKANSIIANYTLLLNGGFNSGNGATALTSWSTYLRTSSSLPSAYLALGFGLNSSDYYIHRREEIFAAQLNVPYSAAANSPAARGTLPGDAGDPLRYAELFPAVARPGGVTITPASWSYALVAGAASSSQNANPMQRSAGATGSIVLKEQPSFNYTLNPSDIVGTIRVDVAPAFSTISDPPAPSPADDWANDTKLLTEWLAWVLEPNRYAGLWNGGSLRSDGAVVLVLGNASLKDADEPKLPSNSGSVGLRNLWETFAADHGFKAYTASSPNLSADYRIYEGGTGGYHLVMPLSTLQLFFSEKIACAACEANRATILSTYTLPSSGTRPATQHITTRPTTVVRSGTGDVSLAASGDVRLDGQASIYSAGRRDLAAYSDFTSTPANAVYGVGGGQVEVTAGGNISARLPDDRTQMQHYVEWLKRQGATDRSGLFLPAEQSSWWVDYANFQRGIGALGGGNVTVSAGGDLDNLTVVLPTNGRVRGGRTADERKLLEMRNGGAMTVTASGSIRAGYYYIGHGAGTIEAGDFAVGRTVVTRDFKGNVATYPIAPILSLGDATLDVSTAGDLLLQTVLDPLLLGRGTSGEKSYMSGLTDRSALSLTSVGGDVTLVGQTKYLSKDIIYVTDRDDQSYETVNNYAANLYPSRTLIAALNGSVRNRVIMNVLPGTKPELRVVAGKDVMPGTIVMGRDVLDLMPSPFMPKAGTGTVTAINLGAVLFSDIIGPSLNDYEPSRIYAREGTIFLGDIYANEQTWFRAGKDIRDINYRLRNLHPTDVSLLEAGNDIIGGTRQIGSVLSGVRYGGQVEILGPGALVLSAGRDVYGTDLVLYSRGNQSYDTNNRVIPGTRIAGLPDQGAAITVMAGLKGKQPSYEAFMAAYLDPANVASMPDYLKTTLPGGTVVPLYLTDAFETRKSGSVKTVRNGLVSFVEEMTGEKLAPLDAWTRFKTLPQFTQERFLRQVYLQELREAGADQNEPGAGGLPRNGGYNRGYAAIDGLFPGHDWKGDVTIGNALFRTMAGGDIEVLTPGGGLQVAALGTDPGAGYGLVTLGYGNIDIFARNNVVVNRSRILTFAGGDETIWSTQGDIDAGRGAKTTRVPSAPEIQTNGDTVTKVLEKADISGSGIGTIVGFTGVEEGDVNLIAPQGTVNAGDAGVRVSGNLNIAALFVLNANNFQVSGEVKGLPPKESSVTALKLDGGNSSQKAAADAAKDATQSGKSQQASIIIVEVLGYGGGGGSEAPVDQDEMQQQRRERANEQRTQNPDSAYQVLGAGQMTAEEARQVIAERRRASGQR